MGTLIVFSENKRSVHQEIQYFESWDRFRESGIDASGFWIDKSWSGDIDKLADQIRRSQWWDRLAFTEEENTNPILDGKEGLENAAIRVARAELAKHGLNIDFSSLIPAEKLLLYLYVRGEYELIPRYTPEAKSLYVYPIAEYLGPKDTGTEWVHRIAQSQLLSPVRLINRIRLCKACGSGHLSFVDVCPSCSSIEIKHTPSIHCFTCGHTSRKMDFEQDGALACPKCETRLRHIGVDYDLPTAQYACRQCHSFSMEAKVVAHCLDCDTKEEPDRLDIQEVYSLTLNSKGVEALRQGHFHDSFAVAKESSHVIPAYFKHLLQWSVIAQQRYGNMSFGVLLVEFTNIPELLSLLGASKVYSMINEYAGRIRQILRESDVTSIDTSERLWVLMPFSAPENIEERLLSKSKEIQSSSGARFDIRITSLYAPRDIALSGKNPENIMHALIQR